MASGISAATIAGNLTRDAELNSSGKVLSFGVAVNRREKDRDSDEWGETAHFFDCKVLGNRAQPLAEILKKGTKVTVFGDLVQERWETDDGQKRSVVRILAREIVLGGSGSGSSSDSAPASSDDGRGW